MPDIKKFDLEFYTNNVKIIAGIDEVGRGPLAGPVVASAVIFDKNMFIDGVDDSKKIVEKKRKYLSDEIKEKAICYSFGVVDQNEIDEINILQATLKAMKAAAENLSTFPDLILIDGNKSFTSIIVTKTIIKGDAKSFSIAAASILAKVKRDNYMIKVGKIFPVYKWEKNKGYGTKEHVNAIKEFGFTDLHRKTFLTKIIFKY